MHPSPAACSPHSAQSLGAKPRLNAGLLCEVTAWESCRYSVVLASVLSPCASRSGPTRLLEATPSGTNSWTQCAVLGSSTTRMRRSSGSTRTGSSTSGTRRPRRSPVSLKRRCGTPAEQRRAAFAYTVQWPSQPLQGESVRSQARLPHLRPCAHSTQYRLYCILGFRSGHPGLAVEYRIVYCASA